MNGRIPLRRSPSDPSPERQHLPPPPPAPTAAGARLKGRPTTESTPEWPEFDAERQEVMILGEWKTDRWSKRLIDWFDDWSQMVFFFIVSICPSTTLSRDLARKMSGTVV